MNPDQTSESVQAAIEMAITMVSTWGVSVLGAFALLIAGRSVAG